MVVGDVVVAVVTAIVVSVVAYPAVIVAAFAFTITDVAVSYLTTPFRPTAGDDTAICRFSYVHCFFFFSPVYVVVVDYQPPVHHRDAELSVLTILSCLSISDEPVWL